MRKITDLGRETSFNRLSGGGLGCVFEMIVIATCAKPAVAIQPLDRLGALSLPKRLDCFVVPPSGTPRNDRIRRRALDCKVGLKSEINVQGPVTFELETFRTRCPTVLVLLAPSLSSDRVPHSK